MSIPYQKKEERDKAVARMLEVQIEMDGSGTDFDKLLKLEIKFDKLRQKYLDKLTFSEPQCLPILWSCE
jgi:hypothetical protein